MTMFLHQYYLGCLSHASYLIGDLDSGRAVVVDPQRDVSQYLADARSNGLTIERVIETHFHADFLSGHLELVEQVGATIVYGEAAAGRTEFDIETMADGTIIALGRSDDRRLARDPADPGPHTRVDLHRGARTRWRRHSSRRVDR